MNSTDSSQTISDYIKKRQLKIEHTSVKVDIHDSLVDVYRNMYLHEEKYAVVSECLKECGYIKLRTVEHQILN
jgi:hypothetical protein